MNLNSWKASIMGKLKMYIQRHVWLTRNGKNPKIWGEVYLLDEIEKNSKIFLSEKQLRNRWFMHKLRRDIIDCTPSL